MMTAFHGHSNIPIESTPQGNGECQKSLHDNFRMCSIFVNLRAHMLVFGTLLPDYLMLTRSQRELSCPHPRN